MGDDDPETFVRARSAERLTSYVNCETHRLEEIAGRRLYAKILRGVRHTDDGGVVRRLKWVLRPSRALQVWRVGRRFDRHGLRCAPVALAARGGSKLAPVDVLIMEEAAGRSLSDVLMNDPPEAAIEACRRTGESLAALHRAGILHGDATHSNIFLAPEGADGRAAQAVWIDNDRTRAWPLLPSVFARRNVEQMAFRVRRWGLHPLRALVEGYADAMGLSESARRRFKRQLARHLRARRAELRRRGALLVDPSVKRRLIGPNASTPGGSPAADGRPPRQEAESS